MIWRPVSGGRQHRTLANLPKAFPEEPDVNLSQGQQNMRIRFWHSRGRNEGWAK